MIVSHLNLRKVEGSVMPSMNLCRKARWASCDFFIRLFRIYGIAL